MTQQDMAADETVTTPDPPTSSHQPTTIAITSLSPLHTLASLDDESDSDIASVPGGRTSFLPFPNCCRWHLTDVRSRYKLSGDASVCAPFAVRVASTNLYLPALGGLASLIPGHPHQQIHTPLPSLASLPGSPSASRPSTPPPSATANTPTTPARANLTSVTPARVDSRCFMPTHLSAPPTPKSLNKRVEVRLRWYAVTRGREITVIQGWFVAVRIGYVSLLTMPYRSGARLLVHDLTGACVEWHSSEANAHAAIEHAISEGSAQILS